MNDRVKLEIKDGVADVRLARSDKMNAFDTLMFEAVVEAGERLKQERGLRAVVLSGEGRAFCSGLDTSNFSKMASGERTGGVSSAGGSLIHGERTAGGANRAQQAVMVWSEVPVPVIAAVHGAAFGAGLQLALGADMRFVTPDARLSVMEIKWGLVPDMAGFVRLRGLVRDDVARDLIFSGRQVSGEEAHGLGLATRVCADPLNEALGYAREIAGKNPDAVRAAKRLLALSRAGSDAEILMAESQEQTALIGSPNQVEAVMANLQKRAPTFS